MEASDKAWLRVTCSGIEYYGRITIIPVTDEIKLIDRVWEELNGGNKLEGDTKVILEYPHILTRTQAPDGNIHVNPMPLYTPDAKNDFKFMVLNSDMIESVMPIDPETSVAKVIREAEGLVSKIVLPTSNILTMKKV